MCDVCSSCAAITYMAEYTPVYRYHYTQPPTTGCLWNQTYSGVPEVVWPYLDSAHLSELALVFAQPLTHHTYISGCTYTPQETQMSSFITGERVSKVESWSEIKTPKCVR